MKEVGLITVNSAWLCLFVLLCAICLFDLHHLLHLQLCFIFVSLSFSSQNSCCVFGYLCWHIVCHMYCQCKNSFFKFDIMSFQTQHTQYVYRGLFMFMFMQFRCLFLKPLSLTHEAFNIHQPLYQLHPSSTGFSHHLFSERP